MSSHKGIVGRDNPVDGQLGLRLRQMREGRHLTLRELAALAGVSFGFLGQIESGRARPSIATLERLADAFGVPAAAFLEDAEQFAMRVAATESMASITDLINVPRSTALAVERPSDVSPDRLGWQAGHHGTQVIRRDARRTVTWPSATGRAYLMTPDFRRAIEVILSEYDPGRGASNPVHVHDGEVFGFVLEGTCEVRVGAEVHRLEPGDAIYFESDQPHAAHVVGVTPGLMMWVQSPPAIQVETPRS